MAVLHLNSENFEKEVLEAQEPVLVDFYADWCGPCKMMVPVVEKIEQELEGQAKVCKINVDEAGDIAAEYGVMSIPTFIVFKQGKPTRTTVGMQSEEILKDMIKEQQWHD